MDHRDHQPLSADVYSCRKQQDDRVVKRLRSSLGLFESGINLDSDIDGHDAFT